MNLRGLLGNSADSYLLELEGRNSQGHSGVQHNHKSISAIERIEFSATQHLLCQNRAPMGNMGDRYEMWDRDIGAMAFNALWALMGC